MGKKVYNLFIQKLHDEFIAHINELKVLDGKLQKKVKRLEEDTQREEQSHVAKVTELHKSNQTAFTHLQVSCVKNFVFLFVCR